MIRTLSKKLLSLLLSAVLILPIINIIGSSDFAFAVKEEIVYTQSHNSYWDDTYDNYWYDHSYGYQDAGATKPGTIDTSGCGIMAYVNAVAYLTGNFIDPNGLADWSVDNGYRVNGDGTAYGLYEAYANSYGEEYGFEYVEQLGPTNDAPYWNALSTYLSQGDKAIVVHTVTDLSGDGHVMALVDYDSSTSKYLLLDSAPASYRGTGSNGGVCWATESQMRRYITFGTAHVLKSIQPDYLDIGSDFYAYIIQLSGWKHLENTGSNVQIATGGNDSFDGRQVWHFVRQDNGSYKIISAYDGQIFDLYYGNTENGTNIQACGVTDSNAQRWYIIHCGGAYSIKSACGNAVVDCNGGSTAPGTNVQIWEPNGTDAQIFSIYPLTNDNTELNRIIPVGEKYPTTVYGASPVNIGDSFFAKIKNIAFNKYITNIETGSVTDSLIGADENNELSQVWRFERYKGNAYKIVSVKDNWVFDVHNYGTDNDTPLEVYPTFNQTTNQLFYIYQRYDGYYIKPLWSNLFVDMAADTYKIATWNTGDYAWEPQEFDIIKLTDHTWNAGEITTPATCTEEGVMTYTCTVCGAMRTEPIQPLGHDFGSNWNYAKDYHYRVCRRCILNGQYFQEQAPHVWDGGEITVPATCSATGVKTYTCTVCDATKTEVIPKIEPEALAAANITRTPTVFYANGKQQQPEVTVKNTAGKVLTEGTDYKVTYPESVEPGSYMVRVDGINGYKGTVRKTYTIKAVEALDAANITRTPTVFYANGKQQQPTVTVKNAAGKTLKEGTDYRVVYPESIEPGDYMVRVDGINGYTKTIRKKYTIKPVEELIAANITRTPTVFYANGKQQQPTVTVTNTAGKTLKEGTDYRVTYPESIEPGDYLLRVDGINGYTKTIRKAYTIKPVEELAAANITRTPTVFYANGKQQQPTVTVKNAAGKALTEGVDYTVTYPTSIEPGSYMVRVDGINGYKKTIRKAYTIKPAKEALDASRITRTPTSFVANGTQQQPTVIVLNAAGEALTEGVDYKVTYPTSVEPGSYMLRVDGINGYSGNIRKAYTIK